MRVLKQIKAHCNTCLGERNHKILHEEDKDWSDLVDNRYEFHGGDTYRMLECCGCEHVNLQHSSWCSEDIEPDGSAAITVTYYPPAISKVEPIWLSQLDGNSDSTIRYVAALLREVYSALHNDSRRLAVMGIRALLEHLMITTLGKDYRSFAKNLNNFQVQGNLSGKQRTIIESVLEAGHATIHRSYNPSEEDVNTILELAEGLVATVIVHTEKSAALKKRVPKRGKKTKTKAKPK